MFYMTSQRRWLRHYSAPHSKPHFQGYFPSNGQSIRTDWHLLRFEVYWKLQRILEKYNLNGSSAVITSQGLVPLWSTTFFYPTVGVGWRGATAQYPITTAPWLWSKWHSIPQLMHYFWPGPIRLWSKVVHYVGNRVSFRMQTIML